MGFDNECILNIQSLAGEYFCPVCRLLVYPNEALQSQCTHLYCKPCLTYVVSTSRACPYDGYLVTEADSKPLVETNKALAETIGNIPVHCLYHRSGCQWQGSLSSCVSHCATCAFGNSPVACNKCAVHIVHRQVQDHALTCSGVAGVTGGDQAQPAVVPGNDANQQAQVSAEQYYQQYQHYYQHYYQQNVVASNSTAAAPNLQSPAINQVGAQQQQSYPQPFAQYPQPQAQQQAQTHTQQYYDLSQTQFASKTIPQQVLTVPVQQQAQMHVRAATQQYCDIPQSQFAPKSMPQQVLTAPVQQQPQMHVRAATQQYRDLPQSQFAPKLIAQQPQLPVLQQQQHLVQRPYFQQLRPVGTPHSSLVGRPTMPGHGVQSQPHSQFLGGLSRPVYHQENVPRVPGPNQSGARSIPAISAKIDSGSKPAVAVTPVESGNKVTSEGKTEEFSIIQAKENEETIKQECDVENKLNHSNVGVSHKVVDDEKKDALEEGSENNKQSATTVVEKKTTENGSHKHGEVGNLVNDSSNRGSENGLQRVSLASAQIQDGYTEHPRPLAYHHDPTSVPFLPPPPVFDSRAGTMARSMNQNQRPLFMDARPQSFPGSLEHRKIGPSMKGVSSFDPMPVLGPRREFPNLQAELLNSFPAGRNLHMPDQVELLHDMKRFPRPGSVPSIFPPWHDVGPSIYSGERRVIHHEDPFGRSEPNRGHSDSRSLGREHLGVSLRGFPRPDLHEIRGRELRRLGERFPGSFSESRFSMLPSHLRRSEFEAPVRMGLDDCFRNDFIGHNRFSSHPHGRERVGHHSMYDDFHMREKPVGFTAPSLHARTFDSFRGDDRPRYPSLGESGFRSNLPLHGSSNVGGITTIKGELRFDKKRKAPTMGWCRICKVDCETVEGLDLHSQTGEHQKMAMDVVVAIKKNAKKKKIQTGEQSSHRAASKPKNGDNGEDLGEK